ncbi:MAG: Mu transposase domain-containing protein, partial [Thermoleophilaceae bacterium]
MPASPLRGSHPPTRSCSLQQRPRPPNNPVSTEAGEVQAVSEPLLGLPELPFAAEHRAERVVSRDALVSFEGNRYSVAPG